jgi:hypothetical protein
MNKMLYFRMVSAVADDDDRAASTIIPVDNLKSIQYNSTALTIYFTNMHGRGKRNTALDNVVLTTSSDANSVLFAEELILAIETSEDTIITVVDKVLEVYLNETYSDTIASINITAH